jgi:hypothetical protein
MKQLKRFKTFEEINFKFDDDDWKSIELEKIKMKDEKLEFVDSEKNYLTDCGFVFAKNYDGRECFKEDNKMFYIKIVKTLRDKKPAYFCSLNIMGKNPTFEQDVKTNNDEDRLKSLKIMMKKIYMLMWNLGFDIKKYEEEEIKRKDLSLKMKEIDPLEEEDWTN